MNRVNPTNEGDTYLMGSNYTNPIDTSFEKDEQKESMKYQEGEEKRMIKSISQIFREEGYDPDHTINFRMLRFDDRLQSVMNKLKEYNNEEIRSFVLEHAQMDKEGHIKMRNEFRKSNIKASDLPPEKKGLLPYFNKPEDQIRNELEGIEIAITDNTMKWFEENILRCR